MHLFLRGLSGGGGLVNGGGYIRGGLQPVDRCITFVEGGERPGRVLPHKRLIGMYEWQCCWMGSHFSRLD